MHTWPFRSNAITSVNSSWVANSNGDAVRAARGEVTGEAPKPRNAVRPNAEKPKAQYDEHVHNHLPDATDPLPAKDTGVGGVN